MENIIILSNIGSASKKYSVYRGDFEIAWFHFEKQREDFICSFKIQSVFEKKHITVDQYSESIKEIFELLVKAHAIKDKQEINTVALRVVVPNSEFVSDVLCTPQVLEKLKQLCDMDPIHITPALEEIKLLKDFFEHDVPIYFISDSSFHISSQKKIPLNFEKPTYTIGYHGLSCESVISTLKEQDVEQNKLVIVHLGGGSSVTAVKNGMSLYNSMEFSPLGGLLMSSRSGSIDPFVILFYMKQHNLSYEQTLEHLYTQSGIKALSGVSSDLRIVREEAFKGNKDAKYAVMQFVDSIVAHICKALAYTQGIDTLVFTGTIGFRASYIREMVVEKLLWLGCVLEHSKNTDTSDTCLEISAYNSKVKIYTIQVDEMKEMHTHVRKFLIK
jgi:acetate kinase